MEKTAASERAAHQTVVKSRCAGLKSELVRSLTAERGAQFACTNSTDRSRVAQNTTCAMQTRLKKYFFAPGIL
jgi:hypothetical protein